MTSSDNQILKKNISLDNFCEILSISKATARNWIKLNKVHPSYTNGGDVFFSEDYLNSFIELLKTEKSEKLKKRRNKCYTSGSFYYKDYILHNSSNLNNVISLINYIKTNNINLSGEEIQYIIADCAIQLLVYDNNICVETSFLYEFLDKKINIGLYNEFVESLIDDPLKAILFIERNFELFKYKYDYIKSEDLLGLLYISLSNIGERKAKGAYYTPTKIITRMISTIDFSALVNKRILDPCCGSANFLLQLPDYIDPKNIYGYDIDNTAIKITRLNIILKYKIQDIKLLYTNFKNKNFLTEKISEKYDYVIGNPPWGAKFSTTETKLYQKIFICVQNKIIESFDLFVEKSLSILNKDGILYFVLPESILNVKSHKKIRKLISQNNTIKYIEYLGNIFDKVHCPSILIKIKQTGQPLTTSGLHVKTKNSEYIIKNKQEYSADNFSFLMNDEEYKIYTKITNINDKFYLKNNAIFALGIVTGDNNKYISNKKELNSEIIIKGSDIEKYSIIPSDNYINYIPNTFQQTAPDEHYRAKEKLVYKFISNEPVFAYDDEQRLTLNSCNILIPTIQNVDIKYIMAILNSRIIQFIFKKKYNSIKILRSHIEGIPIPRADKNVQSDIVTLVNKLISTHYSIDNEIYEQLELKIAKLYNLSENERMKIKLLTKTK